jgi:hypothetical protein
MVVVALFIKRGESLFRRTNSNMEEMAEKLVDLGGGKCP